MTGDGARRLLEIGQPGPHATVQDLGRPGYAALGVGRSGAADLSSLRLANRLVGNPERLAGIELTLGGLRARFHCDALLALTGAPCPVAVEGAPSDAGMNAPFAIRAGQWLRVGTPAHGLRTYLAVRGGLDVPPVLGSRSTDTLSGIGPALLAPGTLLPIGREAAAFPVADFAVPRPPWWLAWSSPTGRPDSSGGPQDGADGAEPVMLTVLPGPRVDWFAPDALGVLTSNPYTVSDAADRIGARLKGPALTRVRVGELRPEGMPDGALQVPPDGHPILFLADHPVTGGYPVIAVLRAADLDSAGRLRPGQRVRFRLG